MPMQRAGPGISAFCAEIRAEHPVITLGGRAHAEHVRKFAEGMLGLAKDADDWQVAWRMAGFLSRSEAAKFHATQLFVESLLDIAVPNCGGEGALEPQSPEQSLAQPVAFAIASLVRSYMLRLQLIEDAISTFLTHRGLEPEEYPLLSELLTHLLVHLFPTPPESDWGWKRIGWCYEEWWPMVVRVLGNADYKCGVDILKSIVQVLEDREVDFVTMTPLWQAVSNCEWAQEVSGWNPIDIDDLNSDDEDEEAAAPPAVAPFTPGPSLHPDPDQDVWEL